MFNVNFSLELLKSCLRHTTRTWSLEVDYRENQANLTELELVSFKKLLSTWQLLVLTLAEKLDDPMLEGPRLRPAPHKSRISVTLSPKTTAVSTLIAKTNGIKTGTKNSAINVASDISLIMLRSAEDP